MQNQQNYTLIEKNEAMEDKVRQLQNSLDLLRAEVDMKMQIMEQILSTRSEQFVVQKKLIDREHALYESVMAHWKNAAELVASGQKIRFSKTNHDFQVVETTEEPVVPPLSAKRSLTCSAAFTPDSNQTRLRAKRLRNQHITHDVSSKTERIDEQDSYYETSVDGRNDPDSDPLETEFELNSGGESDDGEYDRDVANGMEKRVFVNFYSAEPENPEESSSDPIWLNFLRAEDGMSALCRHCDSQNYQKIYQLKTPGMAILRRHLKRKHKILIEAPPTPAPQEVETTAKNQPRTRKQPCLRFNDHLYKRYKTRNLTEYWRCRESETCGGRLIRRSGVPQETGEHSCLTTAADCDAAEFRRKIQELAENNPTIPVPDVIAAAKYGCSLEVLELIPNDDSLRRTIRRIRSSMENPNLGVPTKLDWT